MRKQVPWIERRRHPQRCKLQTGLTWNIKERTPISLAVGLINKSANCVDSLDQRDIKEKVALRASKRFSHAQNFLVQHIFRLESSPFFGSMVVSGRVPTYPSPNLTLTLPPFLKQNIRFGEGLFSDDDNDDDDN